MSIRHQQTLLSAVPLDLFKALGDPTRLRLFANLACCQRPCTIGEAGGCCPVDPSVASRHVDVLRRAGLVTAEKRGKKVLVSANIGVMVATLRALANALESCCGPSRVGNAAARPRVSPRKKQRPQRRTK